MLSDVDRRTHDNAVIAGHAEFIGHIHAVEQIRRVVGAPEKLCHMVGDLFSLSLLGAIYN
jgi:hypothetical protein